MLLAANDHDVEAILLNVTHEMNATVGGSINQEISNFPEIFTKNPTMVVGVKVEYGCIFITASMDESYFCYQERHVSNKPPEVVQEQEKNLKKFQSKKIKNSAGLRDCLGQLVSSFVKTNNGTPPRFVVVYRDCAPSAKNEFLRELNEMEEIIKDTVHGVDSDWREKVEETIEMSIENYKPGMIGIATNGNQARKFTDRNGEDNLSVKPGTVIQNGYMDERYKAFDLISHKPMRGIPDSTSYAVVRDDATAEFGNLIPFQHFQTMTYYLSYLYAKCPRAVSGVIPLHYCTQVANRTACAHFKEPMSGLVLGYEMIERPPPSFRGPPPPRDPNAPKLRSYGLKELSNPLMKGSMYWL